MKREELRALQYISPIANIPSILEKGIFSNRKAKGLDHESCASEEIQARRERVIVPNGRALHDYVNLYFNARNPMMYLLKDGHRGLVVLAIDQKVLDLPGVVITDRNASRDYTLYKPSPEGLDTIEANLVFADDWTHPNYLDYDNHKGIMCSEVLVPDHVDKALIREAYVSCKQSYERLILLLGEGILETEIDIDGHLFFQ